MIVEIIVLVLTIILALIDTSSIPGTFFLITIICVVIINSKSVVCFYLLIN
ncbi:unnamed protein product [Schistosoma curassoni]|uniref:Uncharacterized protein n=1 Tax=Schistosoma curassoni TaxID=6186 RepID=A0A183K4Z7_9TREM|nr:unnamed protein product [Schistosoma curassoni]